MKHFLEGMKTYALIMIIISSLCTFSGGLLLILFETQTDMTMGDIVNKFWIKFYFTGSLAGVETYRYHIVGVLFFGLINYLDSKL